MSKKNVLHLGPYYGNSWIYNQLINLSRYTPVVLCRIRIKSHLYPLPHSYSLSDLSRFSIFFNKAFDKIFGFYPYFLKMTQQYKLVLIHAHFGNWGYRSLVLKRKLDIPLITTFYGFDLSKLPKIDKWKEKFQILFKEGDLFLVEGIHMKECLVKLGCPERKVTVQHIGIDLEKIRFHVRTPSNKIRILICGNFVEKKGIPYGIHAFAKVKEKFPNIELRIVGDGLSRKEIEDVIKRLNLSNCIRLLGDLDYPKYLEELGKAQILLTPSITASTGDTEGGAPVVLLEAQASGMPVVSTYHADIPEVVLDGKSGLLCEEKDVECLAQKLIYLLKNPHQWSEMGKMGRKYIEKNYNIKNQIEKLQKLYDSLT